MQPLNLRLVVMPLLMADLSVSSILIAAENPSAASQPGALPVARMERATPVDFEKEILPIFKNNCLACHNQTKAKADLVLETPQTIRKGGESGPAVVPGKSAESLLLKAAAHLTPDLTMPPRDNKVNASNLSPEELGLVKLWIDQGAQGEVHGPAPIRWIESPEGLNPIFAVAVSPDGQFAACGRANQIFVYHIPSGRLATRLIDPQLSQSSAASHSGAAQRDMVHSLAFSPDGTLLASGDYRQAKIWRRPRDVQKFELSLGSVGDVQAMAVSLDGNWIAVARADHKIKLWRLPDGKEAKLLVGHEGSVVAMRFSPDGTKLVSGSTDKSLRVWNVLEGELIGVAKTPDTVNAVSWIADGKQVVSGGADKLIHLWQLPEIANGELVHAGEWKGHEAAVTALDTFRPAGQEILSGSADGSLRQWNVPDRKLVREMKHGGAITAVAVLSDGKRFASAGTDHVAKLWSAESGKSVAEIKGDRYAQEFADAKERDSAFAASEVNYRKSSLTAAEKEETAQNYRLKKATDAKASADKAFAEKEKSLASARDAKAAAEKAVVELDAEIKKVTGEYEAAEQAAKQAAANAKVALDQLMQARLPADQAAEAKVLSERVAADAAAVASKIQSASGAETEPGAKESASKVAAEAAAFAQNAKAILEKVSADAVAKSKLAQAAKAAAEKAIDEASAKSFAAGQLKPAFDKIKAEGPEKQKKAKDAVAASAKTFTDAEKEFKKAEQAKATAENELQYAKKSVDQAVESVKTAKAALQSAEEAQKRAETEWADAKKAAGETEKPVRTLAFSPDGSTLVTAGDDGIVHTWSALTGAPFETFHGHKGTVVAAAFDENGELISCDTSGKAIGWNPNPNWALERKLGTGDAASPIVDRVGAVRFSPDGKWLATGSGEPSRGGEIEIWQVSDGALVKDFKTVHSDEVFSLDFSADGKYLASGAADKFVKVVDLASGKLVRSYEGHTHHVLGVTWKRDGRTLASAGADNVVKVWDFLTGERKKTIEGFGKEVTAISFVGATDQAVACSGDSQVRLLRENGDKVRAFEGVTDFMYSVAVTPNGRLVAAGGQDSVLRIWNAADGKLLATFAPPSTSEKLAVSAAK